MIAIHLKPQPDRAALFRKLDEIEAEGFRIVRIVAYWAHDGIRGSVAVEEKGEAS